MQLELALTTFCHREGTRHDAEWPGQLHHALGPSVTILGEGRRPPPSFGGGFARLDHATRSVCPLRNTAWSMFRIEGFRIRLITAESLGRFGLRMGKDSWLMIWD